MPITRISRIFYIGDLRSEPNIINKKHDTLGIFIPYFTSPVIIERFVLKFPVRKLRRIKIHRDTENTQLSLIKLRCGTHGAENTKNGFEFVVK